MYITVNRYSYFHHAGQIMKHNFLSSIPCSVYNMYYEKLDSLIAAHMLMVSVFYFRTIFKHVYIER